MKDKRKDTRAGYLAKNTFIFALGNVGTKFISFFLVPLYTYVLSAEDYGTIDLISTLVTLIVPVLSLNISEAIMRFALDENAEQNKIISAGVIMMFVATVGALLLFPSTALVKILSTYSTYIYFYAVSSIYSQILLSNLRGRELLLGYSIGNVIHVFFCGSTEHPFLGGIQIWC